MSQHTNDPPAQIDPSSTALVLIECQSEWLADGALLQTVIKDRPQFEAAQRGARAWLDLVREAGVAIAHVGLRFLPGHRQLGAGGFGLRGAIAGQLSAAWPVSPDAQGAARQGGSTGGRRVDRCSP